MQRLSALVVPKPFGTVETELCNLYLVYFGLAYNTE